MFKHTSSVINSEEEINMQFPDTSYNSVKNMESSTIHWLGNGKSQILLQLVKVRNCIISGCYQPGYQYRHNRYLCERIALSYTTGPVLNNNLFSHWATHITRAKPYNRYCDLTKTSHYVTNDITLNVNNEQWFYDSFR